MKIDQQPPVSEETKSAVRDLAEGLTATEGTDNPTLNGDERNVGKGPDKEEFIPHSETHRANISFESDRNPWLQVAQEIAK